jgi:hypothetical protein
MRPLRYAGAAAVFAVGADHLYQDVVAHYAAIPTIGTLFVLNFVSATLVALTLAAPVERLGRRAGPALLDASAFAGIGIAAGSLVALIVSERTSLFGFRESGYHGAIVLAIALDATAILLLAAFLATSPPTRRRFTSDRRHRSSARGRAATRQPSHPTGPASPRAVRATRRR